jgi:hypothetical protein
MGTALPSMPLWTRSRAYDRKWRRRHGKAVFGRPCLRSSPLRLNHRSFTDPWLVVDIEWPMN